MNEIPFDKLVLYSWRKDETRIDLFLRKIKEKGFPAVTKQSVTYFIEYMRSQKHSNAYLRELKRVIRKAVLQTLEQNQAQFDQFAAWERTFKAIRIQNVYSKFVHADMVTMDELRSLVNNAESDFNRLLILFLYYTGCRVHELANMKKKDFKHFEDHDLIVVLGKNQKLRDIPVDKSLWRFYQKSYKETVTYIFEPDRTPNKHYTTRAFERILRNESLKTLGRPVHPHLLRHSKFTAQFEEFKDPIVGARQAGHDPSVHMKTYCHPVDQNAKVAKAFSLDKLNIDGRFLEDYFHAEGF